MLELNEDSNSAITEIGNICIAGGANQIAKFSNEIVDISVVSFEVKSKMDLILELNISDDCKTFLGCDILGELENCYILFKIPNEIIDTMLKLFPKLEAFKDDPDNQNEALKELVHHYVVGFCEGMSSITGFDMSTTDSAELIEDLDVDNFKENVLCYKSIITLGYQKIDFDVYFFSDAEVLIPKVLEAIGM